MADPNKYGLHRSDLTEGVRRQVRQECGFACVECGRLGQHYDHFAPEFDEAREHKAEGIALLCATCHQDKTSGRLSNTRIREQRAVAKEKWKDPPWRSHFSGPAARLRFGTNLLVGTTVGFQFGPVELLRIEAGTDPLEPWLLSGGFADGTGDVLRLERNDVVACSGNWDVTFAGTLMTYRAGQRRVVVELEVRPDELGINRLNLEWPSGVILEVTRAGDVVFKNLRHTIHRNQANNIRMKSCIVQESPRPAGFAIIGISNLREAQLNNIEVSNCKLLAPRGMVDFRSVIDLEWLLSEDMLSLENPARRASSTSPRDARTD